MRILLVLAVLAATATMFWSGSRYPSLNEKAIMGGSAALEDPLSFEASCKPNPAIRYRREFSFQPSTGSKPIWRA